MKDLTKVVTGLKTRFSYANVWEPRKFKGDRAKYSICLIIPKEDGETLSKVEQAIAEAYRQGEEKLTVNGKTAALSSLTLPLRDGDMDKREDSVYHHAYYINARSDMPPGIVDGSLNRITEKSGFYSGCYGRASIHFYAFNYDGKMGIACGLNNLQKLADGPVLGNWSTPEEDFGDIIFT
ncbi:DUF2815 family protein [Dialister succinatiphilus]|uniref:DUF2815 family protein n=1 Tax=Dialister succinatiphilus TaxID=487173 RepID=UPI003F813047